MDKRQSDLSGTPFSSGGETSAIVVFPGGERREVKITEAEAFNLRENGRPATSLWARVNRSPTARGVAKFVATALVGAFIAAWIGGVIGDRFSDRQLEVALEADLVQETSQAVLEVYEQAQTASRLSDPAERRQARNDAADAWSEQTNGSIAPRYITYYGKNSEVTDNWFDYQTAVNQWAVLACCTTDEASRRIDVTTMRSYVEAHTPPERAPTEDEWNSLITNADPPPQAYQNVGLALLRGRSALLADLRQATPDLD